MLACMFLWDFVIVNQDKKKEGRRRSLETGLEAKLLRETGEDSRKVSVLSYIIKA